MAYDPTTAPVRLLIDIGLGSGPQPSRLWLYTSTHNSTQIVAAGFFTGAGFGSGVPSAAGTVSGGVGMSTGDILINQNTATNGISFHTVSSLSTSTGWNSSINATVGAGSTV